VSGVLNNLAYAVLSDNYAAIQFTAFQDVIVRLTESSFVQIVLTLV